MAALCLSAMLTMILAPLVQGSCVTSVGDDPACPKRGGAMLQRVSPSAMLQRHNRSEAPAPRKAEANNLVTRALTSSERSSLRKSAANSLAVAGTLSTAARSALYTRAAALHKEVTTGNAMLKKAMAQFQEPQWTITDPKSTITNTDPQTTMTDSSIKNGSNELDRLILEFMNSQASSQDRCPAKLLEAKHQLNQLHRHMYSVAWEINTTQTQLKISTKDVEHIQLEWEKETKDCDEEKEKCDEETSEYKKQWEILIWELIEMKQIANPGVVITASDMSYAAWQSAVSHNWTQVTQTSSTNFTEWSEMAESSGTGIVPDYEGTGDKPPWWPSLIQIPAGSADVQARGSDQKPGSTATSHAGGMGALMAETKDTARQYQQCLARVQVSGNGNNLSRPVLHLGQLGRQPTGSESTSESSQTWATGGSGRSTSVSSSSDESSTDEESSSYSATGSAFSNVSESEECKAQLVAFEITYYKAYRQVTRLITEYELLVNSTTCTEEVEEECTNKEAGWTLKLEKDREILEEKSAEMVQTKGHIEVMSKQEKSLRIHIQTLTETCADMDETISDLDKVRDAIMIFGQCAGLVRPQFHIPVYSGEFKTDEFDSSVMTNEEIDAKLNALCAPGRAAEIGELMQQAVKDMPERNPSSAPLYGTCPHCNGWTDTTGTHRTGYYRNCWAGGAVLDGHSMKLDCGATSDTSKAALCVHDKLMNETSS